ncbi:MAG: hypothetical protein FRX48_05482 [Lasallia pustulata]|uniref:C2H2-type domain-containing protein n=1 Tax=Lasallia pustulata TaxID=136370 RepID=A0A5M8PQG4_9LECA|nr:MAG: hypothetical protein FRX48_05482 [Lasallia pustulata]
MAPPQVPTGSNQRPPLQPTTGNANPNLYRGLYQNQSGQPYNQRNKGGFRPNYPRPNSPHEPRAYHGEIMDQFSQFDDYENDYYNNGRFEQEDSWANYTIDEDQAFNEDYKEGAPETNKDIDAHHAIAQASYHCRRCPESFSSNNALHKHVRSGHNPGMTKKTQALTQDIEINSAYLTTPSPPTLTANKKVVRSNTTQISAKGYGFCGWRYAY